ncbi:NAD(P)/FAD-dependent oxidoreductase [Gordonia caeni]|uniref:FAD-dependent oxidoreductase n=1 Tax=Gordonia caeni TaxID=1007097 RepID=A0ABP7NRH2_9ACTN
MIAPDGTVVVVGGGLAAARTISTLRRKKFTGPIELITAEEHLPYDRPPLSKDVLRGERDQTALPFDTEKLGVRVHTGTAATGLDTEGRRLHTTGGEFTYDGLVLATGADPVRVPGDGPQLTLRTLDDALALRARLQPGARVVLIGASWIGAEVATVAAARGAEVTCLEAGDVPLGVALGTEVARHLLPWWSDIDLRCGTSVAQVRRDGVELADGTALPADVVVTGIGVRPAVGWLAGSGLQIDRGVLTDERCRTGAPGVVALGDAAQRWSPRTGRHELIEHWDDAGAAAATAVAALLTEDPPAFDPAPYFWSDQFGRKIQYVGRHGAGDTVSIQTTDAGDLDSVQWIDAAGTLTAWLGVDRPRDVVAARTAVGLPAETETAALSN